MSLMVNKVLFIINPAAGQGAGKRVYPEIDRLSIENQLDYKIILTEYPNHATAIAKQASMDEYDHVVAVGGDGTSNEVLNGLMQAWTQGYTNASMGVIAIGRGNDFAYGMGIPPGLIPGFDIIKQFSTRLVDVGHIVGGDYPQGRYFGNGVGIGFDAVVGFEAAKLTHLHGFTNYVVAALRTIFLYFNAPTVRIDYNEKSIVLPALMVSVMNGRRMGGGFMMAPNGVPDDGRLDICIAGQVNRVGILLLIPKFMNGTQARHPQIKTFNASKLTVTAVNGVLPAHADGETICTSGKELSIELIKKPLKLLCG
jgi:YegS/Rv2252/BmrU family lipid kinase